MIFDNMGDNCASGIAFTRNPSTGQWALYGEFLVNAQGEDVVAGLRMPQNITESARIRTDSGNSSLEKLMPTAFDGLQDIAARLEMHYRRMQDLEFTIEQGRLWILQTRGGVCTACASLKITVDISRPYHSRKKLS